jgi:hypothetical protein
MPKPEQPLRQLELTYNREREYLELDALHRRLNDQLLESAPDLETAYAAADLGTAAAIASALNTTNTRLNQILAKLRLE